MSPLVYCNGDSYSAEVYHPSLLGATFADHVAQHVGGTCINPSLPGSCNRRIVRRTMHDIIQHRRLNPNRPIIALLSLSFALRSEIWFEHLPAEHYAESNFHSRQFTKYIDWTNRLEMGLSLGQSQDVWLEKWNQTRAFYYSPYAERINLWSDLIGLTSLFDQLKVGYLIWSGPLEETLETTYLVDFFRSQLDHRVLDPDQFSFCVWCSEQGFVPLDYQDSPRIAHYGPDAHLAFAQDFLIPKLQETHQI